MSLLGRIVAKLHGRTLSEFRSIEEARVSLVAARDQSLGAILKEHGAELGLDHSLDSLKRIEAWFLSAGSPSTGRSGYDVPQAVSFYFGSVLSNAAGFSWVVEEYPFEPGKYEIGVRRSDACIMLSRGWAFPSKGNKRHESMWRQAVKYAS